MTRNTLYSVALISFFSYTLRVNLCSRSIAASLIGALSLPLYSAKLDAAELVWSDVSYTDGSLTSPTYTVDGVDIVVTTTGQTQFLINNTPLISNRNEGGLGPSAESLEFAVQYPNRNQDITITVTFDGNVEDVSFTIFDIDVGSNQGGGDFSFVDQITVTGLDDNNNTINPTSITGSPNNTVMGNVITGTTSTPNSGPGSGLANATIMFDGPIQSFTFIYGSGSNVPNGSGFPTGQAISLHNIEFTPFIPEPEVYAAAGFLLFCLGGHWWKRRRALAATPDPVSSQG